MNALKQLSDDRAVGFHKCIEGLKAKLAALKKLSSADKQVLSAKFAAKEITSKDRIQTLGLEQKDIRKECKSVSNQLRMRDKDLAKTTNSLRISQRKLSEVHSTLTEVMRERDNLKRVNKTLLSESNRLRTRLDGQDEQ